jgi:heterodisulfide reductase subunit A-like polyferredoxin
LQEERFISKVIVIGEDIAGIPASYNLAEMGVEVYFVWRRPSGMMAPRYIREGICNACGLCALKCPWKAEDEFQQGLTKRKAIYIHFPQGILGTGASLFESDLTS